MEVSTNRIFINSKAISNETGVYGRLVVSPIFVLYHDISLGLRGFKVTSVWKKFQNEKFHNLQS
jgi:hypothetical protein